MKKILSALMMVLLLGGAQVGATEITVGLFPWVPRMAQFENAIEQAWKAAGYQETLKFVGAEQWDGGYDMEPPADLDVFVFDAIFLAHFQQQGYLAPLEDGEVDNLPDIVKYATEGSRIDGLLYGIPQLGCASLLFYRKGDEQLEQASSVAELVEVLGQCQYTGEKPPKGNGLMVDVSGGTTAACLYVDTVQDIYGEYTSNPPLPSEASLMNPWAISNLHNVVAMASTQNAQYEGDNYDRAKWFGQGYGRATIGYTESMSVMGHARDDVAFKLMPFYSRPSGGVSLFYADIIGINSQTQNKALALKLANLMASSEVMVKSIGSDTEHDSPQYLMPVRHSVFKTLKETFPLYQKMYELVTQNDPKLFLLGKNAKSWLANMKHTVKHSILANPMCSKPSRFPKP